MATKQKTLDDLFLHTLKDIYYAEKQILKALPKMAKGAESDELKAAFQTHREQTQGQIERLEQIFELLGKPARGVPCEAIKGIIDEGTEIMEDFADSPALDAGILSAAQAVEHYEITRYGTLKTWAQELGLTEAVTLLDQTLQEEKETDALLIPTGRGPGQRQGGVGVARSRSACPTARGRILQIRPFVCRCGRSTGLSLGECRDQLSEETISLLCERHQGSSAI